MANEMNTSLKVEPAGERDWFDTEPTAEDWSAVGWERGVGIVPERTLLDLPDRPGRPGGEANVLFARDVDVWSIASATFIDGEPVELTDADRRFIEGRLDDRAEQLRSDD